MEKLKEFIDEVSIGYVLANGCKFQTVIEGGVRGRDAISISVNKNVIMIVFKDEVGYTITGLAGNIKCNTERSLKMKLKKYFIQN